MRPSAAGPDLPAHGALSFDGLEGVYCVCAGYVRGERGRVLEGRKGRKWCLSHSHDSGGSFGSWAGGTSRE